MQTTITLKCLAVVLLTYVSQFRKIQFSKILKNFEKFSKLLKFIISILMLYAFSTKHDI